MRFHSLPTPYIYIFSSLLLSSSFHLDFDSMFISHISKKWKKKNLKQTLEINILGAVKISKFSSDQYLEESCSFSIVSEHLQHQIYVTKINNKSALNIYCLIGLKLILVPLVWFVYLYSNPLIVYFMLFLKGQFYLPVFKGRNVIFGTWLHLNRNILHIH